MVNDQKRAIKVVGGGRSVGSSTVAPLSQVAVNKPVLIETVAGADPTGVATSRVMVVGAPFAGVRA